MRAVPDWTVDRARRDLAGYAVDDLSWTDYGTAVVEVLGNVVGFEAGSIAMVDPASGLFTELTSKESTVR